MDWEEIGKRAFNRYFNWYDKTESHDDSQELARGEIENAMEDAGIEIECSWYEDLPVDAWVRVASGFIKAYENIEKEVGYEVSEHFMGPAHTWFVGCMFDANAIHNDPRLKKLLEKF